MNLTRISELKNLILYLNKVLKKLKERKEKLEKEVFSANSAQERMEYAAASAKNRVSSLSALGLRAGFLEDIICPIQKAPDCSGISTTIQNEISGTEKEISITSSRISSASQEKKKLEMEDAQV